MSRTIQRYQIDFGLAMARELQRNQERSRRGKTPLQPSLQNGLTSTQNAAAADASTKSSAAQSAATNQAYVYSQSAQSTAMQHAANLDNADNRHVPSGGQILWDMAGGMPSGYIDTGYVINVGSGANRRLIRKQ